MRWTTLRAIFSAGGSSCANGNLTTPNYHVAASPHRFGDRPGGRHAGSAGGYPAIHLRIVSAAGVQIVVVVIKKNPAPDDHLATGPDRHMACSGRGGTSDADGCPSIGAWTVTSTRVQVAALAIASPNNHFTASPDTAWNISTYRRVEVSRRDPSIRNGVVPAAGIQIIGVAIKNIPPPDDHLTTSPDCSMILSS